MVQFNFSIILCTILLQTIQYSAVQYSAIKFNTIYLTLHHITVNTSDTIANISQSIQTTVTTAMTDGSLCAMGGLTPMPVMSAVRGFPEDFQRKGKNKFLADAAE